MLESIRKLKEQGSFPNLNREIPYAGFVSMDAEIEHERLVTILRRNPDNVGNTQVPLIHGGVVGALLEHAAIMQLLFELDLARMPRIVNISIDYLRPCLLEDTFARGIIVRLGRRIANVRVEACQSDPDKQVATARAHFLLGEN